MDIIINRVAIWQPSTIDELTVRKHPTGTQYRTKDSELIKIASAPFYRYAKNYEVDGEKFCLFVRTLKSLKKIEGELDKVAKKIDKSLVMEVKTKAQDEPMAFEYTDYYILEDKE